VTNISMGPEIDKINEFEEILDRKPEKKPQAA
jgi:glyoxylate carboligase